MYDRSDLVTSPAVLGYKLVIQLDVMRKDTYVPPIPSSHLRLRNRLVVGIDGWAIPTVPCIRLKVSIQLKAERALSLAGSVSSLVAVGDIVLGAFQSCDAEVVGRAERIGRAVEFD